MKIFQTALAVLAIGVGGATLTPTFAHSEIGVFAAANQDLTGARPSENARPLFIQDKVVANERIASSTDGGGQILFLDQSSLTISPNSDIVLDQYVYNPDTETGELGLTVLKGALRLVGGRITKKNAAIIRTPTATIGIRGGMGSAVVGDDGVTRYMHIAGISSTITTDQGDLTITREGGFAEISPDGGIEYLGVAPAEFVNAAYSKRSTGGGDGGGSVRVEQTTEGTGDVEEQVSGDPDATDQSPISTTGEQQDDASDEQSFQTAENDATDESSENFVDEIDTEFDQQIDGLLIFGQFDAVVTADFDGNGTPGVVASQQDFFLAFSLQSNQGVVVFSLPETGDDLTVDAEVLADISAVGLDTVLNRGGAGGILNSPGVDGFLVSGLQFTGSALDAEVQVVDDGNSTVAVSEISDGRFGFEEPETPVIFIEPDDSGGRSDVESFAGGAIQQVDLFVNEDRGVNGNFDILYDGNPEFESLDRVTGTVDLQAQEAGNLGADVDGAVDGIRVLIEEDSFDTGPDAPVSDPNV